MDFMIIVDLDGGSLDFPLARTEAPNSPFVAKPEPVEFDDHAEFEDRDQYS